MEFDPFMFSDDVFEDDDLDFSPFPSAVPWVTASSSDEGDNGDNISASS